MPVIKTSNDLRLENAVELNQVDGSKLVVLIEDQVLPHRAKRVQINGMKLRVTPVVVFASDDQVLTNSLERPQIHGGQGIV